ncbi:hypothetical protein G6011_08958 [Alternaria panax]|uniref:Uncharacterized protein n=1 Tax=Alternaria panax TaxID=48097 RepID=A0AAD4NQH3_9PLEO|nr:hypothetical protein G6011_08958 [Alternaria panax]
MEYRKYILDGFVDESNKMLKGVVEEANKTLQKETEEEDEWQEIGLQSDKHQDDRVKWVDSRHLISKNVLVDHVHLNEESYRIWDAALWPLVEEVLGTPTMEHE